MVELGAEKAVSGYCRGIVDTECDRAEADVDLAVRQAAEWLDVYAIRRRVTDQLDELQRASDRLAEMEGE